MLIKRLLIIPLFLMVMLHAVAHTVHVTVTEKKSHEPVVMGTVLLQPIGLGGVTDLQGKATLKGVPNGEYMLQVSYVGFQSRSIRLKVEGKDLQMRVELEEASLALHEVSVTAKQNVSGTSTSSIIGRQAIDHLQASSLADIMQLVPGQLMGNHDLTQASNLQLRQLTNNSTSAFGSSVVVDGVPMSNNGAVTQGAFSQTAFTGTDLRQLAADDIDEVEVIRGIPSAEYGDLTSGLVVVHSKVGATPLQVKAKVNPALQNYSMSKGANFGRLGIVNVSLDYAKAWGDPRQKTRSYDRYTVHLGYGKDITRRWHTDTKLRFVSTKDWNGQDPDAVQNGNETKNKNLMMGLTHNGRVQLDLPLARTLKYTVGLSYTQTDNRTTDLVGKSTGRTDVVTAMTTGYNNVSWISGLYQATGITESRPGNVFLKASDDFFLRKGKTMQRFKLGVEYRYDWNNAEGYYNADDTKPYKPNEDGRPRPFHDIPGLHQLSAFAEDNFSYNINKVNRLRLNFGLRFTSMQPFGDVSTTALSPRLNASFSVTKWLDVRAGFGMNSKTPGLTHLYPDKKYIDQVAANYMPQDNKAGQLINYHTVVYDVEYSRSLKNATTTKVEVGIDAKLPGGRRLSLLAYYDKTPNGFGPATEYVTYFHDTFEPGQGLDVKPGQPTTIDFNNPATHYLYFMTTGRVGNTNTTVNRGIEADFNLGEIKPLRTSVYLSGAWSETKTWSTDLNATTPREQLPAADRILGHTSVKIIYPSGLDFSRYRRFMTTLRLVTHIPELRMVASLAGQAIWHNSNWSYTADKDPIGWIDGSLQQYSITPDMLGGYIGFDDARYHATAGTDQHYMSLDAMRLHYTDTEPTEQSITWNTQARLTKELGRVGSLSFYVSNAFFYEPYLSSNKSSTLTQRNTGTFSFGAELSLNL